MPGAQPAIASLTGEELEAQSDDLGALLHACVHAGASVGFVLPFSRVEARAFWTRRVLPGVREGTRVLLVARLGGGIAGTVQLAHDTLPNAPHRAEVSKLLVHPDFRRRGIARALMADLERRAKSLGRTLLTLDTRSGDVAEPLYLSLGYRVSGVIPDYCLDPFEPRLDSTTIMYRLLPGARSA